MIIKRTIIFSSLILIFSNNAQAKQEFIYCPEYIECSSSGKKDSCKPFDASSDVWNGMTETGRIQKGIYKFHGSSGYYQSPGEVSINCSYTNSDAGFIKGIYLISNKELNLQAVQLENSKWQIGGYLATCYQEDRLNCPSSTYKDN